MTTTKRSSSQLRHLRDESAGLGREIRVEVGRGRSAHVDFLWVEPTTCGQEITHSLVHDADRLSSMIRYSGPDIVCPICLSHYQGGR
jgi:hypothetical protein